MSSNRKRPARACALAACLSIVAACGEGVRNPFEVVVPNARLTILSGGGQTVALGDSLALPVEVRLDVDGVPTSGVEVKFMVIADHSPGPNHNWVRTTGANGLASANGIVQNTGKGGARIVVVYEICVAGFKTCTRVETAAAAETRLTVN